MKEHSRLKLPTIVEGSLISKTEDSAYEERSLSPPQPKTVKGRRKDSLTLKGVASAMIAQRCWANEVRRKWESALKEVCNAHEQEKSKAITFNAKAFKAHIQACGEISSKMKTILRKFSRFRTEEEVKLIGNLVKRLKVFEKYPVMVKEELGRILYYDSFEDGRIITKQGQSGISFYFIVSGTVVVERIEIDKQTGLRHIQRVDELGQGDSFGELALLHNSTKRAASMICREFCEFLRIDRGEFEDVLQTCREKEWELRATILADLKLFSNYTARDRMFLNSNAKLESYAPQTIILSHLKQRSDRAFIIVSGACYVVRELTVIKRQISNRKYKYILPSHEFVLRLKAGEVTQDNPRDTVECHHLIVHTLTRGEIFNLGECLQEVYYISSRRTEVIHIAKATLKKPIKSFEKTKDEFAKSVPSREEVFKDFVAEVKWKCFKRNLIQRLLEKNKKRRKHCQKSTPLSTKEPSIYDEADII